MLLKKVQALFSPEQFQGWGKTKRYFEGWYFKIVNEKEDRAFAFIPGIAMDEQGIQQAFVQVLDGKKRTADYYKFEAKSFQAASGKFEIRVDDNFFSGKKMQLNLPMVKGQLHFRNPVPWPDKWYAPGIMGPFSFVPFMECYHGIVSLDHRLEGHLNISGESINFSNGRGYIEKDWGRSFPAAFIWMQSNHFSQPGISIKASVAKIPWLGSSFVGFIAGVWLHDRLIKFTTYNFSKLRKCYVDKEKVKVILENHQYHLEIMAHREAVTLLASPISGFMDGRVEESMTATMDVRLFDKKNKRVLLQDSGRNTSLEVAGKVKEIML